LEISLELVLRGTLVFLRVASALAVMPVFGYRGLALPVKAGLSVFIALLLLPTITLADGMVFKGMGLLGFLGLAMPEILAGLILGMTTNFIFYGVEMAGQLVGIQMGFGIVAVLDPMTETQVSIISQLQYIFAILIFLSLNGHHFLLEGVARSYLAAPLGGVTLPAGLLGIVVKLSGDIFVAAFKIAAPVMAALFLTEVALGIIARTVPQMNIFIVSFPLKIGVGLLTLALSWPLLSYILQLLWKGFQGEWEKIIALMGH
jgi:flagellar biosynthetic protein FliR